ncbi:MAG: hypothetical protein IID61_10340 [SAR324 cluster bacterium]|nr:hypothetical protein [SAR324 cluster bacterium]
MRIERCIYCSDSFDAARGEGDHIIPAAFGEFRGDTRFRRICPACNQRIGRSEEQLLRCGLESLLRRRANPRGRRGRRQGSGPGKAAHGTPPPQLTIAHDDHRELVMLDPEDSSQVLPVDLLVIHDDADNEEFVRLFPGMSLLALQEKIRSLRIKRKTTWLHCDEYRYEEYLQLVEKALPGGKPQRHADTEAGVHPVQGTTKFILTDHYFRAIAKIAFHYYLAHTRRSVRGDEPGFAPIRDFIMNGGEKDQFFHASGRQFVPPHGTLGPGCLTPANWCHMLVADEREEVVVSKVQLFIGPGVIPLEHYVTLGPTASRVVCPDFIWGHAYHYDANNKSARYVGRVEEIVLTRTKPWPV